MTMRRLIHLVLAVCVTLGLVLGPVVTPASAMESAMSMGDMAAMSTDVMPDMACCPPGQKSKDCPDCPLLAVCMLKTVQLGPSLTPGMVLRHAVRTAHAVMDDALADGVDRPPPDHPPRT